MNKSKKYLSILVILLIAVANAFGQVNVNKFTGDASYGLPLVTVPNFRGPSVSTSISYNSDIKVDQPASEIGLGWNINAGGSIERSVNGIPDDWKNVNVPNVDAAGFMKHVGTLHFSDADAYYEVGGYWEDKVMDLDYTRFKMDTINDSIRFYYPNYDTYYVRGAGMGGEISLENYNYGSIVEDSSSVSRWHYYYYQAWDPDDPNDPYDFFGWYTAKDSINRDIREVAIYGIDYSGQNLIDFKPQFKYNHDFYGDVDSRYYPWDESPLNSNSSLYLPGEDVGAVPSTLTFEGSAYHDETYSVVANRNRTRTANYIEYFTNDEINTGVSNFMETDASLTRSTLPATGIGAYRITDPNGYTYHYSLPVYAHYKAMGNFPLDNDYNVIETEEGLFEKNESDGSYLLENDLTTEIFEYKQNAKYAVRWLLTAITGPDFVDENTDGKVDADDSGYWVKYDYGLWNDSFAQRAPYYGSNYAYSSSLESYNSFMALDDENKNTGKILSYSETANQVYYLNEIITPSHTAVFCRDFRNDEQGILRENVKSDFLETTNLITLTSLDYWNGEGTFSFGAGLQNAPKVFTLTIEPENVDHIDLYVDELLRGGYQNQFLDYFKVYDGTDNTGTLLFDASATTYVAPPTGALTSTSNAITIEYSWNSNNSDKGSYKIHWESFWTNKLAGWTEGKPLVEPQLKLSKVLLFDNDDLPPVKSAIGTPLAPEGETVWDFSNLNMSSCYNMTWYNTNKTTIEEKALQSVDLDQDYSLAKGYDNNKYVNGNETKRKSTQVDVESSKTIATNYVAQSGKLTLNKIIYYGLNHAQTQPAHLFDYNASDANDNPNYNTLKQDYWGNYKSDADGNLLRGYVTETSKTGTDAWSLRKITSPLGGVTEIIYESDEYEQVLNESRQANTLRGPVKNFMLKTATSVSGLRGSSWDFTLENQETDFWNTHDNMPLGASKNVVIPGVWAFTPVSTSTSYVPVYQVSTVSYGDATINSTTDRISSLSAYDLNLDFGTLPHEKVAIIDRGPTPTFNITDYDSSDPDYTTDLSYIGGGYVSFKYPIGEKIYGGGTRVKELKVINDNENYVVAYTYNQGTAAAESSDFSIGFKKKVDQMPIPSQCNNKWWYYAGLTSPEPNPFGLGSQVGYGEVTVENKGLVSSGEGKSIYKFNVSDKDYANVETYIEKEYRFETITPPSGPIPGVYRTTNIFATEVIDDFSGLWGSIKEEQLLDVNDQMISKKVYDYEQTIEGAHVSTISISSVDKDPLSSFEHAHNVNVFRKLPSHLKSVKTFSNGRKSESEIVERDPLTSSPIKTSATSINGTKSITESLLAYTQNTTPDYSDFGPKSDDPSNNNSLHASYSTKTFQNPDGLSLTDFTALGKGFWKNSSETRVYDVTTHKYINQTNNNIEWHDYAQYYWAGPLSNKGVYDSDPTVFSDMNNPSVPPTTNNHWRLITETTLMDEAQNVLEQKGYNDRFSASKLGYDNRFTYTSASNSNYVSFTASSFENLTEVETNKFFFDGEVLLSANNDHISVDGTVYPHTGNYMVRIPVGTTDGPEYLVKENGLIGLQRDRTYTASVWVHKNSPIDAQLVVDVKGVIFPSSYTETKLMRRDAADAIQIGDWIQLNVTINVPSGLTTAGALEGLKVYMKKGGTGGVAYFDDLQLKSTVTGSGMKVYDKKTGRVMATLSDNNFATKYVYNDAGQVTEVWQEVKGEGWVKVQSREFNFARDME